MAIVSQWSDSFFVPVFCIVILFICKSHVSGLLQPQVVHSPQTICVACEGSNVFSFLFLFLNIVLDLVGRVQEALFRKLAREVTFCF